MTTFYLDPEGGDDREIRDDGSTTRAWTLGAAFSRNTSTYKFGGAAAQFSGANSNGLTVNDSTFDMLTGGFSIRGWIRPTSLSNTFSTVLGNNNVSFSLGARALMLYGGADSRAGKLAFVINTGTGSDLVIATTVMTINTWYYIELSRVSSTTYLFIDGVLQASAADSNSHDWNSGALTHIASNGWDGASGRFAGIIDDLIIEKGSGHGGHTSGYSVPSTAHTTGSQTVALLHFDETAGSGLAFSSRWKTITSGATAARIAPGDVIRCMAAPDPTSLGQNVTWTNNSRTLTLTSAVTMNITDAETTWTASTNVTATISTTIYREGTRSSSLAIAAGFTTGKVAYFATGTLDLSAYQQVSAMIRTTTAQAAGNLQLKLCSDTIGDTAVHTFNFPATGASGWTPIAWDNAGALSSSIQSIAIYAVVDPGSVSVNIDNVVAAKASSAADSLTHVSLIGKAHALSWVAGTTYAVGNQRKPTQPNRTGFSYKVTAITTGVAGSTEPTWPTDLNKTVVDGGVTWTCYGPEEPFYAVASINGTAVTLEGNPGSSTPVGTYQGETETLTSYKREPVHVAADTVTSGGTVSTRLIQDSGTSGAPITFSGGWNRTDMSTQTGETWWDGRTGFGCAIGFTAARNYLGITHIGGVRYSNTFNFAVANSRNLKIESLVSIAYSVNTLNLAQGVRLEFKNLISNNGVTVAGSANLASFRGQCLQAFSNSSGTSTIGFPAGMVDINYFWMKGCSGPLVSGSATTGAFALIKNLITANNNTPIFSSQGGGFDLVSPNFEEGVSPAIAAPTAGLDCYISLTRAQNTDNDHRRITDGGNIQSVVDQRHTATGVAWRFNPTATDRGEMYPLRLPLGRVKLAASESKTFSIWTRRDSTDIKGRLVVRGGWVPGVEEKTVDCLPSVNTWVQSSTITITPTSAGVVEIEFLVWDGVGIVNSFWVDDLVIA